MENGGINDLCIKHKESIFIALLHFFFFQVQMFVKNSNWLWWDVHTRVVKHSHAPSSSGNRAARDQDGVWVMKEGDSPSAMSF